MKPSGLLLQGRRAGQVQALKTCDWWAESLRLVHHWVKCRTQ